MDTSRKTYKAYSVAQTIKKEIDQTLFKVELEKRKFLTLEREETYLKGIFHNKQKDLNQLKAQEDGTRSHFSKAQMIGNQISSLDRNCLNIHDSIQQSKKIITTHRRQILKYKQMIKQLTTDIDTLTLHNEQLNDKNITLDDQNLQLKEDIMNFRINNMKNTNEFYQSHTNINKSHVQDDNRRKKSLVQQKNFLAEEMRNSKLINHDRLSEQLKLSGIKFAEQSSEVMTESLPLAKQRIKNKIQQNKEKLKITEAYRKFGENLELMFTVMKEYKGRDDLNFIAEEFVTKERQLQKIEEYIGQLESRILKSKLTLKTKEQQDKILEAEVNAKIEKEDKHYATLQAHIQKDIENLKAKEVEFYTWFMKVSSILMPLIEEPLTRSNAPNLIGDIEQSLGLKKEEIEKKAASKATPLPAFDLPEKQNYNQLLSYQKMRQMAAQYVKTKKAN